MSVQHRADDILSVDSNAHEKFKELEHSIQSLNRCKAIIEDFDRIKL